MDDFSLFCQTACMVYSSRMEPVPGVLIRVQANESHVVRIDFTANDSETPNDEPLPLILETMRQLRAYFRGELHRFDLPLAIDGTDFQRRVWSALLTIPYGETRSYAEIARQIGAPRAFRAVGTANGDNPIAIAVPCHRVINSGGALGGYGGGLTLKRLLLDLERRNHVIQKAG
jgi:methylated-DNA-[protein]-cysteine S-methyltransferase